MTTLPDPSIAQSLVVRDDHHCFGCGRLNPFGLHLSFYRLPDGSGIWAPWTPDRTREGFTGMAHGGIISAVLDEVMGWAVYARDIWAVTGNLNVSFRKPVEIGVEYRAIARIVADRRRVIDLQAELRRADDDTLAAAATAAFIRVPESKANAWRERYIDAV